MAGRFFVISDPGNHFFQPTNKLENILTLKEIEYGGNCSRRRLSLAAVRDFT
jgi:hypothetical protein